MPVSRELQHICRQITCQCPGGQIVSVIHQMAIIHKEMMIFSCAFSEQGQQIMITEVILAAQFP
jgi:hypothetical protein